MHKTTISQQARQKPTSNGAHKLHALQADGQYQCTARSWMLDGSFDDAMGADRLVQQGLENGRSPEAAEDEVVELNSYGPLGVYLSDAFVDHALELRVELSVVEGTLSQTSLTGADNKEVALAFEVCKHHF